jgi:isoleucyl-tRNA synthetase
MARTDLYRRVDARVSFPDLEARVAERWADTDVFHRSLDQRAGQPEWVFYEGPPTANNKPGIHHVEPRAFKDIFCRFQTMRGRYVFRKAGWDCHGLPVEVEVEKELGIKLKQEIEEKVGIEAFVDLCRASVRRYVDDHTRFTERIGFWVDMDDAYWTLDPSYIETVWWLLKQIWDKGLLEEDFRVVPYCPRCETSLSSHEQHQTDAYKDIVDPSVYVRFPLAEEPGTALLIWTTTPWTLLANMAVAVNPDLVYAKVADPGIKGSFVIVARERVAELAGEDARIEEEIAGTDLIGRRYVPPFGFVDPGANGHRAYGAAYVTTDDGSGIVHLAPYGEEDMEVAKAEDLPIAQMIDPSGRVIAEGGPYAGLRVREANGPIISDLEQRGLLFKAEDHEHSYPHCWRCGTPLIYYPHRDWYIRTSQMRSELQASNEDTRWQPPTIKYGRFGNWLENNVDWALSRDRYWGTPLPIWKCAAAHHTCVGSFQELEEMSHVNLAGFDPHRPYVDDIVISCPQCGEEARRVPAVIDAWFDSGSMPFAQWHYPFENEDLFERRFPADFITEAIDQTRGWFYSLLAIATLVRGQNSYRNVVVLGHIVDAFGKKMSKSVGNVIDPWTVLDAQGADALRWTLFTAGSPWASRRMSSQIVEDVLRKHLMTLWNTYSFWVTYASLEGFEPGAHSVPVEDRPVLDRWVLAELADTVQVVTQSLDELDATTGGRRLEAFVDDLSNWYVRRSRRRFWKSGQDADTTAAFLTLWECLVAVAQLSAPYMPFLADEIYTNLTGPVGDAPDSVHLTDWPAPLPGAANDALREQMALVRRLVTLGRSARTEAKVRVRQPLSRALVVLPSDQSADLGGLAWLVSEELNVKDVEVAHGLEELVSYSVKPRFNVLGPRFGSRVKEVATALARSDAHALVAELESAGSITLTVGGESVTLGADDLDVRVEGREGFSLVQEGAYGVALDLDLTPELKAEGAAREVVRATQELRKASGLEVEDRIELWLAADGELGAALADHEEFIAGETLATSTHRGDPPGDATTAAVELDGGTITVGLKPQR